jgi:hypothetical protein
MTRNDQFPKDLRDRESDRDAIAEAAAPPPFTLSPLGPDATMGWAGWGAGSMAGWSRAQAELRLREDAGQGRPRREPRDR